MSGVEKQKIQERSSVCRPGDPEEGKEDRWWVCSSGKGKTTRSNQEGGAAAARGSHSSGVGSVVERNSCLMAIMY